MSARLILAPVLAALFACVPTGGFDGGGPGADSGSGGGGGGAGGEDAAVDAGPSGEWTLALFAGSGIAGLRDGPAGVAQFNMPTGLAIDGAGTLWVADTGNRVIRKVDPAGNVSTVWTSRVPAFIDARGVAVDGSGNLYVADTADHCVYKVDSRGTLSAFTGSCSLGDAGFRSCADAYYAVGGRTAADVGSPSGMVVDVDAGILYIADAFHELIRFAPFNAPFLGTLAGRNGTFAFYDGDCGQNYCCGTQFNIQGCRAAQSSAFNSPSAVALAANGDLLVADRENCAIRKITTPAAATCRVSTVAGTRCGSSTTSQSLNGPMGVAAGPGGVVFASDTNNQRVVSIDPSQPVTDRVKVIAGAGLLSNPWGLVAGPGGRVFVVDSGNNVLRVLTPPP